MTYENNNVIFLQPQHREMHVARKNSSVQGSCCKKTVKPFYENLRTNQHFKFETGDE